MAVKNGKYAYVDGIPCVRAWGVNITNSAARHSASCSPDATAVVEGNLDWGGGSIGGIGGSPPLPDAEDLPFVGVVSSVPGVSSETYSGDILLEETSISIPVAAGGVISWAATFGVQGELTYNAADAETEDPTRSQGAPAKYGLIRTGVGNDLVDAVQNINVIFRRPHTTWVVGGLTYRAAGNLEAEVSFDVLNTLLEDPFHVPNSVKRVRVYVSATEYYEFADILFGSHSGLNVDREANALIGYTVNGLWTAVTGTNPGHIILPDTTYLYGEAGS